MNASHLHNNNQNKKRSDPLHLHNNSKDKN